jgi:hypothetical protein
MKTHVAIFLVVIAISLFLLYEVIDRSVTIDHQQAQLAMANKSNDLMILLLNKSMSRLSSQELQKMMLGVVDTELIKVSLNEIEAGNLIIKLKNGKFSDISLVE